MCSWCLSPARSPDCIRSHLRTWTRRMAAGRRPLNQPIKAEWGQSHWGRRSQWHPRARKSKWTYNMHSYSTRLGNITHFHSRDTWCVHTGRKQVDTAEGTENTQVLFFHWSCRWHSYTSLQGFVTSWDQSYFRIWRQGECAFTWVITLSQCVSSAYQNKKQRW